MRIEQHEINQVAIVLVVSAVLTAALMGSLWWSCDFQSIAQCYYGGKP